MFRKVLELHVRLRNVELSQVVLEGFELPFFQNNLRQLDVVGCFQAAKVLTQDFPGVCFSSPRLSLLFFQEPIPEAAAVLLRHPGIRPVRSHGPFLFDGRFPHSVRYVNLYCPGSI